MNCTLCHTHSCRRLEDCKALTVDPEEILASYASEANQKTLQSVATLVDGGLAGTLSRFEELARFIKQQGYSKPGLAYCYGLETEAIKTVAWFKSKGIRLMAVSCSAGGLAQNQVNQKSSLSGVSCNPLTQAAQLETEGVDLAIQFGLCLGHDILFTRSFKGEQTTLVIKDRVFHHAPLEVLSSTRNQVPGDFPESS